MGVRGANVVIIEDPNLEIIEGTPNETLIVEILEHDKERKRKKEVGLVSL